MEDRLEMANNTLKGDWSRWLKSTRSDLRAVFTQTAEKNVEYYEKVSNDPSLYYCFFLGSIEVD